MRTAKVCLITADASLSWISCRSISPNLRQAYLGAFGEGIRCFPFPQGVSRLETFQLAKQIREYSPDLIVFLEHQPHPIWLIHALSGRYDRAPLPQMAIHAYGDFTLFPWQWLAVEKYLMGKRLAFIAASPRQAALVSKMVKAPAGRVLASPFPVNEAVFRFDAAARARERARIGIRPGASLILYTGRLSVQKNVTTLIMIVAGLLGRSGANHRFVIAGPLDEVGTPLFGRGNREQSYATEVDAALSQVPPIARDRIIFTGSLDHEELSGLYNAADVFVSASLHHDEDFGMSAAEALLCGCPLTLTDWGGYGQFVTDSDDGIPIPVELKQTGLGFSKQIFQKAVMCQLELAHASSDLDRQRRSERNMAKFSIGAVTRTLAEIYSGNDFPPFKGFSETMRRLKSATREGRVPYPNGPIRGGLYEKIYSSYLSAQ